MAHTPGPWAVGQTVNNFVQIVAPEYRILTDSDHVVCELRAWRRPRCDDNAKLIALAPELLELLRRGSDAVSAVEADCDNHGIDCYPARHWWQDAEKLLARLEAE